MQPVRGEVNVDVTRRQSQSSVWSIVLFLIALSPVVYVGCLISATAVSVLKFDEWSYVFLFRHFASHTLSLQDLLLQHNESRPAVPDLIVLGVGLLTHWDTRWDMWINFAFACLVSLNIYLLSRRVTGMNRMQCLFLWIITNVLLFSAEQSQNWTWGIQMIVIMPMLFISTAMVIAYSRLNVTWKFAMAIVLATASTFSYAIGQIAWLILLPPLIVGSWKQTRKFAAQMTLWGVCCAANLWLYYRDYIKPPWHPSLLLAWKYPIRAMEYFTAYLGAAVAQGYHSVWASIVFGVILLGCLAGACTYLWKIRRQPGIVESATVWLVLCAYAIASAATATAGRLGFGVIQSQDSRYTGFSVYLVIGLVYLGAMVMRQVYRLGDIAWAWVGAALGLAFVVIPHVSTEIGGIHKMWEDRRAFLTVKACVQLMNIAYEPDWFCYPEPARVIEEVGFLDPMGYLSPGLVKSRDLTKIAGPRGGKVFGHFDAMDPVDEYSWNATGWGIIPYRHDPADVVLLAGEDGSGSAIAFAHVLLGGGGDRERPDVVRALHNRNYRRSGWGVTFKSADVPPGTKIISAWVYDAETGRAHRLAEAHPFFPPESAAQPVSRNSH
jgi:hypothetical protein